MPLPPLAYAQRFEDFHLWRALGDIANGFYVDVGAGHPVYDNVSFAFYLAGWRGIAVEPNPALAALARAVRPRDQLYEGLCGAAAGDATLYLQREFHGLSTTVAEHAQAAEKEVNRSAEAVTLPMATLAALCEQHAPTSFEFLKIDVEGAEADVLRGADFSRFRPKIIVVEAIKPLTLAPAWDEWEPLLAWHGYAYVWDDELNRYYVAEEACAIASRLTEGPKWYADGPQIGNFKGAAEDPTHPDHRLALLLTGVEFAKLPLLDRGEVLGLLIAGVADPARTASAADVAAIGERLFGAAAPQQTAPPRETIREAYRRIIDSDEFRAACGRIAASYAW
ncbi:MAG: FkbM family methyltransferase [Xanthobacteraceae bacterium]